MSSYLRRAIALATLSLIFCGIAVSAASADVIQIPAIAFTERSGIVKIGDAMGGTMTNAQGKFYAAVPFVNDGDFVCRFTLVHRDNDTDSQIIARLFKKRIIADGMPFAAPVLMARVQTGIATAVAGVTSISNITINANKLTLNQAFYYVELEFGSDLLEALGVQIEYAPAC
jgi:hypothetical protein